jgi:ABC-type branched-subunit amino acid transport system substrate-binding protein
MFSHAGIFEIRSILKGQYFDGVTLFFNGIWDMKLRGDYAKQFTENAKKYCSKYPLDVRMAAGFDSFRIFFNILKGNGHSSNKEIITKLRNKYFSGLLGKRTYDDSGRLLLSLPVFVYGKTEFKFFKKYE